MARYYYINLSFYIKLFMVYSLFSTTNHYYNNDNLVIFIFNLLLYIVEINI